MDYMDIVCNGNSSTSNMNVLKKGLFMCEPINHFICLPSQWTINQNLFPLNLSTRIFL